jgi:hypothetical protein
LRYVRGWAGATSTCIYAGYTRRGSRAGGNCTLSARRGRHTEHRHCSSPPDWGILLNGAAHEKHAKQVKQRRAIRSRGEDARHRHDEMRAGDAANGADRQPGKAKTTLGASEAKASVNEVVWPGLGYPEEGTPGSFRVDRPAWSNHAVLVRPH